MPKPDCVPPPPAAPPESSTRRVAVCASLTADLAPGGGALPADVSDLEVRADLVGDIDPQPWRPLVRTLTYSLRSRGRGGYGPEPGEARWQRLLGAASRYDMVDLEADRDLVPEVLAGIPPHQRRISWHGTARSLPALRRRFEHMAATPARLYLVAPAAATSAEALVPVQLLAELGRRDVTAFGTGEAGVWSRLLAPWLGAPVVYGRLRQTDGTAVPTVAQLLTDYPFPALPPLTALYGIVGQTANRSLSPLLHNAAYRALGLPHLFLPFHTGDLAAFWSALVTSGLAELHLPLRGLTVTAPLKEVALALANRTSDGAQRAMSANLMVPAEGGGWIAGTTDGSAAQHALRHRKVVLADSRVAVVGCGGAGRAVAAGLAAAGARVTLVNRGAHRGMRAAKLLRVPFAALRSFDPGGYHVVVNATPLRDALPFGRGGLDPTAAVLDFVYADRETALVRAARGSGQIVIDGWEILHREVRRQFQLMTGHTMPSWIRASRPRVVGDSG